MAKKRNLLDWLPSAEAIRARLDELEQERHALVVFLHAREPGHAVGEQRKHSTQEANNSPAAEEKR